MRDFALLGALYLGIGLALSGFVFGHKENSPRMRDILATAILWPAVAVVLVGSLAFHLGAKLRGSAR